MAGEMVKHRGGALSKAGGAAIKKQAMKAAAKHPAKHPAKHAVKHASKHPAKHASKQAAKKSATRKEESARTLRVQASMSEVDLAAAYHSMQRAGAVVSLLEKETGGDLRELLHRGVDLYRGAAASKGSGGRRSVKAAAGVLGAVEHLSMAGLYSAREKHLLHVPPPSAREMERRMEDLAKRLKRLRPAAGGFAARVFLMAGELHKRAEGADHDVHLQWELAMAADGLCAAIESGLENQ
jgi:hypothetical protein